MGLRLRPVWPLEGAKFFSSRSIISATAAGIATVLSLQCAPFGALYSAPIHWGHRCPIWGSGPPNWKFTFLERNIFCAPAEVCGFIRNTQRGCSRGCKIFMEISSDNFEKSGFEFLAVFNKGTSGPTCRNLLRHLLRLDELWLTPLEWCRYLLPVRSYNGLNFCGLWTSRDLSKIMGSSWYL